MNLLTPNSTNKPLCKFKAAVLVCVATVASSAFGQYHQPLSERTPPGQTAAWFNHIRKYDPSWLQPMRVEVEGGGNVEVYSGSAMSVGGAPSPTIVAANVGHLYRLRVSGMERFPGVDIYPTVELIDRLHPPQGREDDFAIPIIITAADMQIAMSGQLVTRIIYLEQPQIAQMIDPLDGEIPQSVRAGDNALQEADRLGRPMAIIRLGGRKPSPASPPDFFGTGGAVQFRLAPSFTDEAVNNQPPATVRMKRLPSAILQTSGTRSQR